MIAWTTPASASANAVYTSSFYNTNTRDNLNASPNAIVTTAGDYVWATGAGAFARVPSAIVVASDVALTGSYATITGLSWAIAINEMWAFIGTFQISQTGSGRAFGQWTLPTGASVLWTSRISEKAVNTNSSTADVVLNNSTDNNTADIFLNIDGNMTAVLSGFIYADASHAGTVGLQGKLGSGTSATIKKGSHLMLTRLA